MADPQFRLDLNETDREMFRALRESVLGRQLQHYLKRLGDYLADSRLVDPSLPEDEQMRKVLANRRAADVLDMHLTRHVVLAKGKGTNETKNGGYR